VSSNIIYKSFYQYRLFDKFQSDKLVVITKCKIGGIYVA